MKQLTLLFLISTAICFSTFAQSVSYNDAIKAAENKIIFLGNNHSYSIIGDKQVFSEQSTQTLFFIFYLKPVGYVVITSREELPPVLTYSFENNYIDDNSIQNPLFDLLVADIESKIISISKLNI